MLLLFFCCRCKCPAVVKLCFWRFHSADKKEEGTGTPSEWQHKSNKLAAVSLTTNYIMCHVGIQQDFLRSMWKMSNQHKVERLLICCVVVRELVKCTLKNKLMILCFVCYWSSQGCHSPHEMSIRFIWKVVKTFKAIEYGSSGADFS